MHISDVFKPKYRIIKKFNNDILSDIYVEYKHFFNFNWKKLTFCYCGAEIEFASGNLSFINTYNNPHKYNTNDWWTQEELEIIRLLNKWYINITPIKTKKEIIEIIEM